MAPKIARGQPSRHKPPARLRYEETHPVVSFRVKQEVYQQLQELLAKSGKSIGDFFREALKVQQADTKEAYLRGHKKGYEEARKLYRVFYLCSICGGVMEISTLKEKEAAREYMEENRWGHGACHQDSSGGGP